MNRSHFYRAILCGCLGFLAVTCPAAEDFGTTLGLRANAQTDSSDRKGGTYSVAKSLEITLTNRQNEDMNGLVVEYWLVGRDVKSRDTFCAAKGTLSADVKARGEFSGKSTSATFTEIEAKGANPRGRAGKGPSKKVEDSGTKYVGFCVKVKKDGKVLAAAASAPKLIEEAETLPAAASRKK